MIAYYSSATRSASAWACATLGTYSAAHHLRSGEHFGDYDLTGELDAWAPPHPFAGKPHWQTFTSLPVPWSQSEIGGYVGYCRQRVRDILTGLTEENGAALLPPAHRCQGRAYAWVVTSLIGHTTAHATQIRRFITAAAPPPSP